LPEESENVKIRKLVNIYVKSTGLGYEDVWNSIYETLEYRYGNRIKRYKKINSDKSWLDVAIRNNLGQKIYNVISDMVRNVQ
jgi:translation initiation factor 2 alpha subunit (eIF-2alpha)